MAETGTVEKILQQAEQAFLRYGLRTVTMSDLAADMGMSKKTLYRHFGGKEELVCAVVRSFLEREYRLMQQNSEQAEHAIDEMFFVAGYVIALFRRLSPNVMLEVRKYYASAWELIEGLHFTRIRELIANNLERGVAEGLYRRELDSLVLSRLYMRLADSLVDEQLFPIEAFERTALFHQFIAYHMYGIVSHRGRELLEEKLRAIGCIEPK